MPAEAVSKMDMIPYCIETLFEENRINGNIIKKEKIIKVKPKRYCVMKRSYTNLYIKNVIYSLVS